MYTFVNGYCSTVQGLLDWFEVDLGWFEVDLGWFEVDLGWFEVDLGWFEVDLGFTRAFIYSNPKCPLYVCISCIYVCMHFLHQIDKVSIDLFLGLLSKRTLQK